MNAPPGLSPFTLLTSLFYLWGITRCCCLKPSDVHVFGGSNTTGKAFRDNEGYHIQTDSWAHFAPLPAEPRRGHGGFAIDSRVYLVYGQVSGVGAPFYLETERYTKQTDSWATMAQSPSPGRNYPACAGVDGKGYAAGGLGAVSSKDNDQYDPESDVWASKTDMPATRFQAGAAESGGKLYVYGGAVGTVHDDNYEYTPASDSWATKTVMPSGGIADAASGGIAGKCYSWYGFNPSISATAANYEYDPATDAWTTRTSAPLPTRTDPAGAVHAGLGYCVGGIRPGGLLLTDNDVYDPDADSWTSKSGITGNGRTRMVGSAVT